MYPPALKFEQICAVSEKELDEWQIVQTLIKLLI